MDGVEIWQVYGFGGELLAEYAANGPATSPQKEYGYRNGQLLVTAAAGTVPTSGLVGHWKLDENSGTTSVDSAGIGNTGTLTSGAGWGAGQTGAAVNLDAVDDYVQIGSQSSLVMTSAVTVGAWIYPAGPGSQATYGGTILVKEGEYVIARYPNGTIQWGFANSNPGWQFVNTGYVAPVNQWTHIAVTYENGTVKTYANGSLVHTYTGSGSIGDAITAQNDFRIGGRQVIPQYFQGRIDEVRVYNRALTASEIASIVSAGGGVNWLVTDQLGTPRIIFDQTGNLANVKRHDYLPFGEELYASMGSRTAAEGYAAGDGVRHQFTSKERDIETGLDFFEARYYASIQGRFTSPDPLLSSGTVDEPQSWNRYLYVWNNPLNLIDPDGLYVFDKDVSEGDRKKFNAGLAQAKANLQQIGKTYGTNSDEYKKAERALNAYGTEGVNNGITIYTQAGLGHDQTQTAGVPGQKTANNPTGQDIHVTFDKKILDSPFLAASIGHEGVHVANGSDWVKSGFSESSNPLWYQAEVEAFSVQSVLGEMSRPNGWFALSLPSFKEPGKNPYLPENIRVFDSGWAMADRATLRRSNIDRFLSRPRKAGGYGLTPASTERELLKASRFRR